MNLPNEFRPCLTRDDIRVSILVQFTNSCCVEVRCYFPHKWQVTGFPTNYLGTAMTLKQIVFWVCARLWQRFMSIKKAECELWHLTFVSLMLCTVASYQNYRLLEGPISDHWLELLLVL